MTNNLKLKNIPSILMIVFMITAMVYSATAIHTSYALDATPTVFIDPPQTVLTDAAAGTTFDVSVSIANTTGIGGIQFRFEWNASLLNCTSMREVFFHTVTPEESYSNIWGLKLAYNNTDGHADYAQLWQSADDAIAGGYAPANITTATFPTEGKLAVASFTFLVLQVPTNATTYYDCDFNLPTSGVKVGDPAGGTIEVALVSNGYFRIYRPPEIITTLVPFEGTNYAVTTETNASVVLDSVGFVKLNDTSYKLDFNLTGTDGTTAYVNVTIPKALMSIGPSEQWQVKVNGESKTPIVTSNATNWYLYITASLSTKKVEIWGTVPEFTLLLIPLLMGATLVAVGLRRRKRL